jgi:hypothetical protein
LRSAISQKNTKMIRMLVDRFGADETRAGEHGRGGFGGGLMQLVAYGAGDTALTGGPPNYATTKKKQQRNNRKKNDTSK